MNASTLLNWGIGELLDKYPELRLRPAENGYTTIAGSVEFSAQAHRQRRVEDSYEISISVPPDFPRTPPIVRETDGRIPRDYHKLDTGHLCLGSPTRLRLILAETPKLLSFVERCVVPYLYGYSLVEGGSAPPFGELAHGFRGWRDDLADLLGTNDENALLGFLRALTLRKRIANKAPCPCGTGLRVGRCHSHKLNPLRKKLGRRYFSSLLYGNR